MTAFMKRNLKVFFRDKSSVFFSLLAVLIVLGLYVLFLGDQLVKSFEDKLEDPKRLMDSWIMAGILAVTPISTTLGSFGIMVEDKTKKIYKDFRCSPIRTSSIAGGYILSSFIVGLIMSFFALGITEIYFAVKGYGLLSAMQFLKISGAVFVSVLTSSSLMYLVVCLFNSQGAFATASTIIGTLIGFITGIYLPIGSTDKSIQYIIEFFPVSHAASIFRKILMEDPIKESFRKIPEGGGVRADAVNEFRLDMGVDFNISNHDVTTLESILYLVAAALVFYTIGIIITGRKNRG